MRKALPWLLIAIPSLYLFALLAGAASFPGFSHVTNYASELGAAEAPYPALFNVSIMLCGIAAVAAAALLPAALGRLGSASLPAVLAGIALGLWGIAMIMGGAFPMPDDRHGGFGLGLAAPLVPLFLWLALKPVPDTRGIRLFLGLVFVASLVLLAIMFGAGGLVTRANVGLWQRANSAVSIPWLAVIGVWLMQARGRRARA